MPSRWTVAVLNALKIWLNLAGLHNLWNAPLALTAACTGTRVGPQVAQRCVLSLSLPCDPSHESSHSAHKMSNVKITSLNQESTVMEKEVRTDMAISWNPVVARAEPSCRAFAYSIK